MDQEDFEDFISSLENDREIGVMRTLTELMNKTEPAEIIFFFSFWYVN